MDDTVGPRYIPINRDQTILHPLDIEKLIPADQPARKIWAGGGGLDLRRFEEQIRAVEDRAGRDTFSPRLLLSIWIHGYSKGIHSARQIERRMAYEPALEWLAGLREINRHTLSDLRVEHGEALRELFTQVLALLTMKKLLTLERLATDGAKIRADVSKKSFSQKHNIRRHLKRAREHVAELERQEAEEQTTKRQQAARRRAARDEEANEFVCPEGKRLAHKQSRRWGKAREQHVWSAAGGDCRGGRAQALCCPGIDLKKNGRSVAVSVPHPAVEAFDEKMRRPEAQALYKQRAPLVEFPNAWIKQKLKPRRFSTPGLAKVKSEALWAALTCNPQRMFRLAPERVPSG